MTAQMNPAPATSRFADLPRAQRLVLARRGTSYCAQRLAELTDAELDEPSLLGGWSRRHLTAHVGYNAAALCRLMDWAVTGEPTPMYASPEQRADEIAEGATLNAGALRNLFTHTVARLDEKWRHAPEAAWSASVRTAQGRTVAAEETIWMRSREVWIHAVDLANGGRFADFPTEVLTSLLADIVGMWRTKELGAGLQIIVGDDPITLGDQIIHTVAGDLPAVVRWAAGRGAIGLARGADVVPPRWL